MNRVRPLVVIGSIVALSTVVLLYGRAPGWLIVLAGFLFVAGGTLTATMISEGRARTVAVLRQLPPLLSGAGGPMVLDESGFLRVSEAYRRGLVRQAERELGRLDDAFLRQGAQTILDGGSREELERGLQWRIARVQEQEKRRLRVLQAMAGFAPAFGMLGTLLGLVRMLFGLGDSGLDAVGSAMGFAMITTVYGLVAANLAIKPALSKLEQRSRERLAAYHIRYQLLMMMSARCNGALIRESLRVLLEQGDESPETPAPAAVRLVQA